MVQTASERKNKCRVQVSVRPKMCPCTTVFWVLASYRLKMPVKQIMVFPDETGYAVCPKCHVTMEREYVNFCDRCGQRLGWNNCKNRHPSPICTRFEHHFHALKPHLHRRSFSDTLPENQRHLTAPKRHPCTLHAKTLPA